MTPRQIISMLKADGWVEVKLTSGTGHRYFKHPVKKGKITLPMHSGDVSPKVANNILKQAGLK